MIDNFGIDVEVSGESREVAMYFHEAAPFVPDELLDQLQMELLKKLAKFKAREATDVLKARIERNRPE